MTPYRCLYTIMESPTERWEEVLREAVAPVAREIRSRPELDSLFFVQFAEPTPQIRFRILGEPSWVDGYARPLLERRLAPLEEAGLVRSHEFGIYGREVERYGGEEGMRLTEAIYHHDSLAALDLIEADRRGDVGRSRRELNLVMAERMLDRLAFDRERRLAFYEQGYRWAVEAGDWKPDDFRILDQRYETLKAGLVDLLRGEGSRNEEARWGGPEPARIAGACFEAIGPLLERALAAHRAGRISQELVYLAWSWAHLSANRLGVPAVSEAVLRYFMHRLYRDSEIDVA